MERSCAGGGFRKRPPIQRDISKSISPPAKRIAAENGRNARGWGDAAVCATGHRTTGDSILGFLRARAIADVEVVENGHYLRTVEMDGFAGSIDVSHQPEQLRIRVKIRFPNVRSLPAIVARVRRQFDIGAGIETIDAHLSHDPLLAPLIARRPGLRATRRMGWLRTGSSRRAWPTDQRCSSAAVGWTSGCAPWQNLA